MDQNIFPETMKAYASAREELLARITTGLDQDQRFMAAWLAGSYGRGTQDEVSDIDIYVVIEDLAAQTLCKRPAMAASGSIPARLEIFTRFGEPVNIHENHTNAPESGSFSSVLYLYPPVIVDWTFVPLAHAQRPLETRLLFDRAGISMLESASQNPLSVEEQAAKQSERVSFFWMMAAVTAKYIVRDRFRTVQELLAFVGSVVDEIEQMLGYESEPLHERLFPTRTAQAAQLMMLCERIESLGLPAEPRPQVEAILNLSI